MKKLLPTACGTYNATAIKYVLKSTGRKPGPGIKSAVRAADKSIAEILPYFSESIDTIYWEAMGRNDYDTALLILKYVIDHKLSFNSLRLEGAAQEKRFDVIDAYILAKSKWAKGWETVFLNSSGDIMCSTPENRYVRCDVSEEAYRILRSIYVVKGEDGQEYYDDGSIRFKLTGDFGKLSANSGDSVLSG